MAANLPLFGPMDQYWGFRPKNAIIIFLEVTDACDITQKLAIDTFTNIDLLLTNLSMLEKHLSTDNSGIFTNESVVLLDAYFTRMGTIGTLTLNQVANYAFLAYNPSEKKRKISMRKLLDDLKETNPDLLKIVEEQIAFYDILGPLRNEAAHNSIISEVNDRITKWFSCDVPLIDGFEKLVWDYGTPFGEYIKISSGEQFDELKIRNAHVLYALSKTSGIDPYLKEGPSNALLDSVKELTMKCFSIVERMYFELNKYD